MRSRSRKLGIPADFYQKNDIHIHLPEGATPKDGPSAGITMATSIASALMRIPVRKNVAMTGEITLRGNVLPIGGVKEKVLAAHRAQIKKVILPAQNKKDMEDVPEEPKREMEFVFVEHVQQVFDQALLPASEKPKAVKAKPQTSNGKHAAKALAEKAQKKTAKAKKARAKAPTR